MHQSHSRRSTQSRLGKGGYGPLNPFLFAHLKRNPGNLSSLPHIFLPPWHGPCRSMQGALQLHLQPIRSRSRQMFMSCRCPGGAGGRRPRAGLRIPLKTFIEWTIHNFPLPRCGSDDQTVSLSGPFRPAGLFKGFCAIEHRLCFAPAIMDMVIFPCAQAHTETRSHDIIMYHQAHTPRSPTRLRPPARPLSRPRCAASQLTIKLKIEDTRILQHAGSLQVTSSCSCNGTHLTDAAESRPFLALRYESRPSLPL
jgi:hypothetical protein